MRFKFMVLVASVAAVLAGSDAGAAEPSMPDMDAMTRNDVAMLGFLGGVPLTPAEQRAVHSYLVVAYAAQPDKIAHGSQQVAVALLILARHNPRDDAVVRQAYRAGIEALPADDVERRIVDAHDKVIAYNPQARLIVTDHTLTSILVGTLWASKVLGKPAPDGVLADDIRGVIAAQFQSFDHANQEAYAHAELNMDTALPVLAHAPAAEQKAALLKWGTADDGHGLVRDTVSAFAFNARRVNLAQGHISGGVTSMMGQLADRQMQQSIWGMRHPECGPLGDNLSSCSQAPIMRQIMPGP